MAKRLYVAVGSVGVNCLMELIRRYQDEGFYKDTEDTFIGMDTDVGLIGQLKGLDKDNSHIEAVHVVHEEMNSSVRDLIGVFRSKWDRNALIPMRGVGGDRKLSFSTLRWTQNPKLRKWLSELTVRGESIDELILIGTAFGGTSTGMFWNVAMWLRANLRRVNNHCAEFYAFLVLPGDQGGDLTKYPWSYNLCAFLQDLQTLDISQRVQRRMQADIPFRMPVYALYDSSTGRDLLPVWSQERFGASDHTFLPFDRLFLVPTPEVGIGNEAQMPDIVAEQAFVLGALSGWSRFRVGAQAIDLMNNVHGLDYRKPDLAFGGFNMVAGRGARRTALSAIFWKRYREQYKLFVSPGVKTGSSEVMAELQKSARQYICNESIITSLVEAHLAKFSSILENRKLSPAEVSGQLAAVCKNVQETLRMQPYVWVNFADFVKLCAEWIKPVLSAERAPDTFVTLSDLHGIYLAIRADLQLEASQLADVRSRMLDLPAKCRQVIKVRCEKSATKALGAEDLVETEVLKDYKKAELDYFKWFLTCCRADTTKNQFSDDTNVMKELESLAQSYDQRFKRMLEASDSPTQQTSLPACIYQDKNVTVDATESLAVSRGRYLLMLLDGARAEEADENKIRNDADVQERRTVVELGEQATALGPANPLKRITLDFSKGTPPKAYSDVFKVDNTLEWHHHFFVRYGNIAPFTWGKLMEFSPAFRTFQAPGGAYADGQNIVVAERNNESITVIDVQNCESQGAWIGTLQLDTEIRKVIDKTYRETGKQIHIWQQRAFAAVAQGSPQRSLLTLPEMLAFSVILGSVAEQTKQKRELGARGFEIRCEMASFAVRVKPDEVAQYFSFVNAEYVMANINTAWIAPFMAWIDGTFWKDAGMEAFHNSLVELERSILEKMTLALDEEEFRKPLIELAVKVKDLVHVNLC